MAGRLLLTALLATFCVCSYAQEADEYSTGNERVECFLEGVDYSSDADYTVSYVKDYRKGRRTSLKMLPAAVSWAGPVRVIDGVADNMRDLGGWKAEGGHIAYGKLYRGAKLERISGSGKSFFVNDLGISVDLDLRGLRCGESNAGPVIEGVEYLKLPVEKNLGRGTGNTEELYQQAIRCIIGWLGEGKTVYFHCAEGADRTGTLAFLIEALLGVSESDLSKDYELTTFWGRSVRLRNAKAGLFENCVLYEMVTYLRRYGYPQARSMNQLVLNWATARHSASVDPLSLEEIALLKDYLLEKD